MRLQLFVMILLALLVSDQSLAQEPSNLCELKLGLNLVQQCDVHDVDGIENETITQMSFGPDGDLFLSGSPRSKGKGWDVMVSKLNPKGDLLWEGRAAENGTAIGSALALSNKGNVAICGMQTTGGLTDPKQAFVALFDARGNQVWENRYFDNQITECKNLTFVENGDIVFVGQKISGFSGGIPFLSRISSSGKMLWSKKFENSEEGQFEAVISGDDGQIAVGGSVWNNQSDGLSAILLHYSELGKLIKQSRFKGDEGERITQLTKTKNREFAFSGSPWADNKTIIGVSSFEGEVRWKRMHPATETQSILDVTMLKDGTLAVLTQDYSNQVFNIVGFGNTGKVKWQTTFNGCEETYLSEGVISEDGDIYVLCENHMIRASIKKTQRLGKTELDKK